MFLVMRLSSVVDNGALVAVHLAEAGVKTIVLDKRDIGTGSTSASTALLQYELMFPCVT